ncbi:ceramidase domain-containing protein [Actinokineospora soli]|uniref:Ceramidase domain-containing protein n=1 Tax=Actinokineospora soli TaxID=1048753 RepID=A0ABW2TTV1_9PSEU
MPVDAYCERTGPDFWSEPVNALTNVAFLIAAVLAYRHLLRQQSRPPTLVALVVLLIAIGLGSFTFHTVATRWAAVLDTTPILLFMLVYVVSFARHFMGAPWRWAWVAAPVFIGFSIGVNTLVDFGGYVPALLGMVVLAGITAFRRMYTYTRWYLGIAALFAVSLTLRTVDLGVCGWLPVGTHFLWHVLNAAVLYLVIRVAADRAANQLAGIGYPEYTRR